MRVMDHADTIPLDLTIFQQNMGVLREVDPALARVVDGLATGSKWPAPARARDGRTTFRWTDADGRGAWFGQTSIPSVRAQSLIDSFDSGESNVLLPGFGEGSEAALLLERLGVHRAVFVWEPDATTIRLALALHDFSADLKLGRLVFVHCDQGQLAEALVATLQRLPGHLCPKRLLLWPWQSLAEIAPIRDAVESALQQSERLRQEEIQALTSRLACACASSTRQNLVEGRDHVAILSLHAREETWVLSKAMTDAAGRSGQTVIESTVRSPHDMHPLARLRRLSNQQAVPGWALLIDVVRSQMADALPAALPAISWLDALPRGVDQGLIERLGPDDLVAVRSPRLRTQLEDQSFPSSRILCCPPPCLAEIQSPPTVPGTHDVLIFADNYSLDPQNHGIALGTHQQIWHQAVRLIRERVATWESGRIEGILARVERMTSLKVGDAGARAAMVERLNSLIARSLIADYLVQHLVREGLHVAVAGRGITSAGTLTALPPPRTLAEQCRLLQSARALIHLNLTGDDLAPPLLAAGAGTALASLKHPLDSDPCGLNRLFTPETHYLCEATPGNLLARIPSLVQSDRWQEMGENARRHVQSEHLPEHRFQMLQIAITSYFDSPQIHA